MNQRHQYRLPGPSVLNGIQTTLVPRESYSENKHTVGAILDRRTKVKFRLKMSFTGFGLHVSGQPLKPVFLGSEPSSVLNLPQF